MSLASVKTILRRLGFRWTLPFVSAGLLVAFLRLYANQPGIAPAMPFGLVVMIALDAPALLVTVFVLGISHPAGWALAAALQWHLAGTWLDRVCGLLPEIGGEAPHSVVRVAALFCCAGPVVTPAYLTYAYMLPFAASVQDYGLRDQWLAVSWLWFAACVLARRLWLWRKAAQPRADGGVQWPQ